MDPVRATLAMHRSYLDSQILIEEKSRLWLGPVHQVATNVHPTRVCRPSVSVGILSKILSKISGGRVTTETFESGGLDPWGDRSLDLRHVG